ncbi:hypothetical protein FVEG_09922 [Fusarium verticillioides 7600]|uniref:Uncharacterized protein n=1 Tax=Gibberella moniliformis (strain M3125 / FGSC 7600) TaxID=334819 RepID=W7MSR5_GIBM7|nr:hypothetical protein FVEG_09922 [Fusarium verticillioides 7600]EWG50794.1 hypothetical protein FVEG_09922 [Fusarium verticillioides 7600]
MQTAYASGKRKRVSKGQSSTGCITCRSVYTTSLLLFSTYQLTAIEGAAKSNVTRRSRYACDVTLHASNVKAMSNFRMVTTTSLVPTARLVLPSKRVQAPLYYQPLLQEVLHLAQHFTIKPVPTHSSTYEKEARLTLAAASQPAIKHALASLNTLRRVHAERGSNSVAGQMKTSLQRGIQEYTNSLGALATRLADNEVATRKAALLCCQMFISIETALNNFTSAIQHFVRGVQITHQCGRPSSNVVDEMPNVDLFTIKMFLTCPDRLFTFPPVSLGMVEMGQQMVDDLGGPNLCQSMLHARQQLASISMAVISLLERSRVHTSVNLMADGAIYLHLY